MRGATTYYYYMTYEVRSVMEWNSGTEVGCANLYYIGTSIATLGDGMELTRQFIGARQLF